MASFRVILEIFLFIIDNIVVRLDENKEINELFSAFSFTSRPRWFFPTTQNLFYFLLRS